MTKLKRLAAISDIEEASPEELFKISGFLARQVDTFGDADIAYGTYCTASLQDIFTVVKTFGGFVSLHEGLLAAYRKNLIQWMNFGIVQRANRSQGGEGVREVQKGLADFVAAIPSMLTGFTRPRLSALLPPTEFFDPKKLDPIGNKIIDTVRDDAIAAKVLPASYKVGRVKFKFEVQWDETDKVWYIPFSPKTYEFYDQLAVDGFKANKALRRWEKKTELTPEQRQTYVVEKMAPAAYLNAVQDWYFDKWLPKNIDRFTKVFSEYAKREFYTYELDFTLAGRVVKVKFHRHVSTPTEAIEEIRYRYLYQHGREPWLEVLDKFTELLAHTTPDAQMLGIIDRINNLQHSNGLFMEHFPKEVQTWYRGFLNAKYHAPKMYELARYIKDSDLRNLLVEIGLRMTGDLRSIGYHDQPPDTKYKTMEKEEDPEARETSPLTDKEIKKLMQKGIIPPGTPRDKIKKIKWTTLQYPRYEGVPETKRNDPEVQGMIRRLREIERYKPLWQSADVDVLKQLPSLIGMMEKNESLPKSVDFHIGLLKEDDEKYRILPENDYKRFLERLEKIGLDAKRALDRQPELPMTSAQLPAFAKWVRSVDAMRVKLDDLWGEYRSLRESVTAERQRETRLRRQTEEYRGESEFGEHEEMLSLIPRYQQQLRERQEREFIEQTRKRATRVAYRYLLKTAGLR